MLILTRKVNETVNLYRDGERLATVLLARLDPDLGSARLGFDAPADVAIVRSEIEDVQGRSRRLRDACPALPIAVCGPGRSGKDTVAEWFRDRCGLAYRRSTSAVICPHVAADLGISEADAWERRHEDRVLWYRKGVELRADDPAALVRDVVADNDLVVGVRDGPEIRAARDEGLVKLCLWVDRDVDHDPTLTYGPEECDLRLENRDGLPELHGRLERLARSLGLVNKRGGRRRVLAS